MKKILFTVSFVVFSATFALALNHSGNISSNEIWFASDNPHIVTGNITVLNAATLLIQPGCEIYFNGNFRILVYGTLNASGTAGNPIIFTSNQPFPAKGDWRSIYFSSANVGSTLDYCQISYGGSDYALVGIDNSGSNVSISNCTLYNSASYGIRLAQGSNNPSISNCTFLNCDDFPVLTYGDRVKNITGTNIFSGNNPDAIRVNAQAITTGTWLNHGVPYVMWASMDVSNGNTLTLNPGVNLQFVNGTYFRILGSLVAIGTPTERIVFTSNMSTPVPGAWQRLYFYSTDPGSIMEYCDVLYSGGTNAGIDIYNSGSNLTINNCFISHSNSFGISNQSSSTAFISNCTIQNCNDYAIRTYGNQVKNITGTMSFTGNNQNAIRIDAQTITSGTWSNVGYPYVIWSAMDVANANTLTINPGVLMKFNSGSRLRILGTLVAVGTPTDHIVFTSNQTVPTPGYWERLLFSSTDPGSIMEYCDVMYGGGTNAAIDIINSGNNLTINNCFISHSLNYGIFNQSTSDAAISNCTIENCGDYAIRTYGDRVKSISGTMNFSGNNADAIRVDAQTITTGIWKNTGVPFIMWADMTQADGTSLTIEPGCILKFNAGARLQVNGQLLAEGTPGNPIKFTSNQVTPTSGYWERLYFYDADAGTKLDYCEITYGGGTNAAIDIYNSGSNITITNCLITNSGNYGIYNSSASSTSISNTTIQNCNNYPIYTFGDKVKLITGTMVIAGNNPNAIRVDPQTINGGTWYNHNVPYIMWNDMDLTNATTLTINPGTQLHFNSGARLRIYGCLIADGTPSERIVFTSAQSSPTPGSWERLLFDGADAGTILNYCDVLYGGGTTANIDIYNSGSNVTITNSTIRFSSSDGIYIRTNSTPTIKNTTIRQNLNRGVYIDGACSATFGNNASEWNEIYNNSSYQLRNGTLNTNAKYVYWGSVDCGDVAAYIYDKRDLNSLGLVNYVPWIGDGHDEADLATTWTGNNSTVWSDDGNWSNYSPCEMMNVTVPKMPSNQPIVTSPEICNNLTLEGGAKLTVQTGSNLSVKGNLSLQANANGTSSLLEYGNLAVAGSTTAQFYVTANRWHYVSSPMSNTIANTFYRMYLYSYNEPTDTWFNIVPPNTPLNIGQGFKVWSTLPNPGTKSVTFSGGILNTGNKFLPVTRMGSGWNLVGNPYPSAIDWDHASWIKTQIDATVYVWDGTQYLSWNGSVGSLTDGVIPAMQAFFVKATAANPYLVVTNSARLHGTGPYKNSEVDQCLELTLTGNGYSDKTYINFNEDATESFDSQFDGHKLFGIDEAPQLFSYIDNEPASINVFPEINKELIILLGAKVGAPGDYVITSSGLMSFDQNVTIYLEDIKLGKIQNLMDQPDYTFSSTPLDDENRFKLHFFNNAVQEVHENIVLKDETLKIYSSHNNVYIKNMKPESIEGRVFVYNILGKEILNKKLDPIDLNKIDLYCDPGYYIVRVLTSSGSYSQKVFIK